MQQANNSASCYRTSTWHWLFSQTQSVGFPNVKPRTKAQKEARFKNVGCKRISKKSAGCSDVIIEPTWLSVMMRFCSAVSDSTVFNRLNESYAFCCCLIEIERKRTDTAKIIFFCFVPDAMGRCIDVLFTFSTIQSHVMQFCQSLMS